MAACCNASNRAAWSVLLRSLTVTPLGPTFGRNSSSKIAVSCDCSSANSCKMLSLASSVQNTCRSSASDLSNGLLTSVRGTSNSKFTRKHQLLSAWCEWYSKEVRCLVPAALCTSPSWKWLHSGTQELKWTKEGEYCPLALRLNALRLVCHTSKLESPKLEFVKPLMSHSQNERFWTAAKVHI